MNCTDKNKMSSNIDIPHHKMIFFCYILSSQGAHEAPSPLSMNFFYIQLHNINKIMNKIRNRIKM